MTAAESTALTRRELAVLRLRADGHTHAEIADELDTTGTTGADVREIERAAERTIERARRTLDLATTIRRSPVELTVAPGTTIEDLADEIYTHGDDAGIDVGYCHADLHAHLRDRLEDRIQNDRIEASTKLTLTEEGDVTRRGRNQDGRELDRERASRMVDGRG